jgi:hypothetical protein
MDRSVFLLQGNATTFETWFLFPNILKLPHVTNLMCIGLCIVIINEEAEQTRSYLVFYYIYDRLNMLQAALRPSSGANDYISDYHIDRLMVGG